MDVFISWSGQRSGQIAEALRIWLPKVIQTSQPWISSSSIEAGVRWNEEVTTALANIRFAIVCLTPENANAPWVLFEAGALAKAVTKTRVVPYLVGIDARELQGPLAQFQAVRADEAGTLTLLQSLNNSGQPTTLDPESLKEAFQVWWPKLAPTIKEVLSVRVVEPAPPKRTQEDMLGEVLELLRRRPDLEPRFENPIPVSAPVGGSLAQRVYHYRSLRGMSQVELGALAQVHNSYISNVEAGRYLPPPDTLLRLANALGVKVNDLVDGP
jgi:DNA-binding XRE family transcriptional regulator